MMQDFYCDKILKGHTPIQVVLETENILAYHHTKPQWPVHIVVIPKHHVDSLLALSPENTGVLEEMNLVLRKVIQGILEEHGGCRLTTNFGNCQTTKHLHWHVYVADNMMS
jgi:histidine triad (HIT) family protein